MKKHPEIVDWFLETCAALPAVRARAMFGGHGLYSGEAMFGLEAYGELYLKVDAANKAAFIAAGAEPFVYETKGGQKSVMSYYCLPAEILEDPSALLPFLRSAHAAALQALDRRNLKKQVARKKTAAKAAARVKRKQPAARKKTAAKDSSRMIRKKKSG